MRRFNLNGQGEYSFDELRLAMKVSNQRVQQIEQEALIKLRMLLGGGKVPGSKQRAHPALLAEIANLKATLEQFGFPLPDAELWEILTERYGASLTAQVHPFFILLCDVLQLSLYRPAPLETLRRFEVMWLPVEFDRQLIVTAAKAVVPLLRNSALPVSLFDLLIAVNRDLDEQGRSGTDEATLRRILEQCPLLEAVAEDIYQWQFADLSTNILRVERIMYEWAGQGNLIATVQQLRQELNHRLALSGYPANTGLGVVSGACASSLALVNIGKSGGWTLRENATETRPLHEIIEEALLVLNRPATPDEIVVYVEQRRQIAPISIAGLLGQHHKFQRVGRGLYALRAWGLAEAPASKRGKEYQRQFDEALLDIFLEHNVEPIPLAQLASSLSKRLGWSEVSVRQRLDSSPLLDYKPLNGSRLLALWRDNPKDEPDEKARETKRGRAQEVARRLLHAAAHQEMAGATLSSLIEHETGYERPTIYNSLAAMPDVVREGQTGNMVYRLRQ